MSYQSEQQLENNLVAQLTGLGLEFVKIGDVQALRANLQTQLSKLNNIAISENELKQIRNALAKGNVAASVVAAALVNLIGVLLSPLLLAVLAMSLVRHQL